MELRTLRYFLAVASEQNITHAAQKLNISQPPLSRQLAQLEEELGVSLFIRGKRRIQLTEEGKYLAQQAQHILNMADHTAQQLSQMKSQDVKGQLLLGITETCSAGMLPDLLPHFSRLYPQVSYDLWCGSSSDVSRHVEQGIIDIGIIREPLPMGNFESVFLSRETWIAIASKGHPLAHKEKVTVSQLCQYPLFIPSRQPLQNEVHTWLASQSGTYHVIGMYNQISSIVPLVAGNMGIAICAQSIKKYTDDRQISYINIAEPQLITGIYMICARSKLLPANARAFWDFVARDVSQDGPSNTF